MVQWMESVDSANRVARRMADEGAPHGTAVAAHQQSAGRGRLGRVWQAPPGNLNLSVILRKTWPAEQLPWITLGAGVVVSEVIGPAFALKWPNDLLDSNGKKVAGILIESLPFKNQNEDQYAQMIGIGINSNNSMKSAPEEIANLATSLCDVTQQESNLQNLLVNQK